MYILRHNTERNVAVTREGGVHRGSVVANSNQTGDVTDER